MASKRPRVRRLVLGLRKVLDDDADWAEAAGSRPALARRTIFELASTARREPHRRAPLRSRAGAGRGRGQPAGRCGRARTRAVRRSARRRGVLRGLAFPAEEVVERYAKQSKYMAVLLRAVKRPGAPPLRVPSARRVSRAVSQGEVPALAPHRARSRRRLLRARDRRPLLLVRVGHEVWTSSSRRSCCRCSEECDVWFRLDAEVRWGRGEATKTLRFRHEGGGGRPSERPLSDEAQALLDGLAREKTAWRAKLADTIVSLPGVGLCVPDLLLTHAGDRRGASIVEPPRVLQPRGCLAPQGAGRARAHRSAFVFACLEPAARPSEDVIDEDAKPARSTFTSAFRRPRVLLERVDALANRRVHT